VFVGSVVGGGFRAPWADLAPIMSTPKRAGQTGAEFLIVREAMRFVLVGVCRLLTYFVNYLALRLVLPYLVAHTIAYAVALVSPPKA